MKEQYTFTAVIMDENSTYTSLEVCQKLNLSEVLFHEMEEYGLFKVQVLKNESQPVISHNDLKRIEKAYNIHRDLDVNISGAVLVLDLLDELQDLRQRLAILER